jgi:hypothetical protein
MSAPAAAAPGRNRRVVLVIGGLFLLPLLGAFGLYYGLGYRPTGRTNHGELIEPARPLPVSASTQGSAVFGRVWSLVYVGAACHEACEQTLYVMRQTHLGLNNDADRVQRVFIATADAEDAPALARDHPGLIVIDARGANGAELLRQFPAGDRAHAIYIVDPLANLMMRSDSRADPKGLREDLKRLLRLSHVG